VGAAPEHKYIHDFLRHDWLLPDLTGAPETHHLPVSNSWVGYFRVSHRMDWKTNRAGADTYAVENVLDAGSCGYRAQLPESKCMIVPWKTAPPPM